MTTDRTHLPLVLTRELRDLADTRHQHARAALSGSEVRVGRGAYISRGEWDELGDLDRYRLRLVAFARTRKHSPLFSHQSAAVLHGNPLIGAVPDRIHVTVGSTSGGRSARGVVAHSREVGFEDIVEMDGLRSTSALRTAIDLAATAPRADAVVAADHLVRNGSPRLALLEAWLRAQPMRGHRRAQEVIAFADARAESPLESVSRVSMHTGGVPQPALQVPYSDSAGLIGRVDFAWPALGMVGEADGDAKYLNADLRGGRSAERVVLDEKVGEDRLRALGLRVVRWRWSTAIDPTALAGHLAAAGLPVDHRIGWGDCCA
ncbi:hypothetical protein ACFVU2_15685 [Leifsonia sp. NPDC058194]|uniref:hypothetical protein n=1 Tax=Leifsonia sp. NPDC058194 TaxID=3346374 RepID=UPI0036DE6062